MNEEEKELKEIEEDEDEELEVDEEEDEEYEDEYDEYAAEPIEEVDKVKKALEDELTTEAEADPVLKVIKKRIPQINHKTESHIISVGWVYGRPHERSIQGKANPILIFEMNTVRISHRVRKFDLHVEQFRVVGDDDIAEFKKNIRAGMLIAVYAVRRSAIYVKSQYNMNIVEGIDILSTDVDIVNSVAREMRMYDTVEKRF